jgi:lactoylglutathione lyase
LLDAVGAVLTEDGPGAITLAHVAARAGIGRATVYKYFPDVDSLLSAWHERHVTEHLTHLAAIGSGDPRAHLATVLEAHARHTRQQPDGDLIARLHHGSSARQHRNELRDFLTDLISKGARAGQVRADVPADELAAHALAALGAARELSSEDAVRRLVAVTVAGLEPAGSRPGGASVRCEIFPADLDIAVRFYTEVLGFDLVRDDRDTDPGYVALARGTVQPGAAARPPVDDPAARHPPTGVELVIEVEDLDADRARVAAHGWPVAEDITDRPWELRDFRVLDPDGYYWRLSSRSRPG